MVQVQIYCLLVCTKSCSQIENSNGTADKCIQLIAANKTRIKQLGTVRLRVHVGNKDKVCLFYVVPDKCRPIFGLPDLTSMRLLAFDIPLEHQWEPQY